jgi:AcrR family transcriptional regulator
MTDPTSAGAATRERILECAADLFAARGYHGTSTREIARRVGIRQPSLFHHFPTKRGILAELLERDLVPALERIRRHQQATPAARLYAYLLEDVAALVEAPFDVRGLYNDAVLAAGGLEPQADLRRDLHREIHDLVADGIAAGEFRDVNPRFARRVITGMRLDTNRASSVPEGAQNRPAELADFITLRLQSQPAALGRISDEGRDLLGR